MKMNAFAAASAGMALSLALAGAAEAATIRIVALSGQEAPGTGGAVFDSFNAPVINDSGETAFLASLNGIGVVINENSSAVFKSSALVARQGDLAPGAGGATYSGFDGRLALNNSGESAFLGFLAGNGVNSDNNVGIFTSSALVFRKGEIAPDAGGAVFSRFSPPSLNDSGDTAFNAFLSGAGVVPDNNRGIFTSNGLVVRTGDPAPETGGAVFSNFTSSPDINNNGELAFRGQISGVGVTVNGDHGIFADDSLVVRVRDEAPGTGGADFTGGLGSPVINDAGQTAYVGLFDGVGFLGQFQFGIFTSDGLIAKEGDVAPGSNGALFQVLNDPALNNSGNVAFQALLASADPSGSNSVGIFSNSSGSLELVLRTGDLIDIGDGDLRTITSLGLAIGGLNKNGDIAFRANFAAGANGPAGRGVFVYEAGSVSAAVPLPPALGLMLFGVAALGFVGRRRARG